MNNYSTYFSGSNEWITSLPIQPDIINRPSSGHLSHLPRGSSPSSLRQRTVGAGSPWTSHRKSTVSSSMTTWFTGLRTKTGRSTGRGMFSNKPCSLQALLCIYQGLTIYHQLSRITVPLSNHVFAHANIHASIVLLGVRDHEFATTHLKKSSNCSRD